VLYSDLSYYRNDLLRAVRQTVERYEPRLHNIRVQFVEATRDDCVVGIELAGQLPDGRWAHFESAFQRDGQTAIYTRASRETLHAGLL
jgi:predicted component of type VI protein secretion system